MKQMQHIFSVATHDLKRVGMVFLLGLTCCLALQAQHSRRDDDAALRKLQLAEMAIYNLYVDSVNQNKLVEDGIPGDDREGSIHTHLIQLRRKLKR